MGVSRGYLDGIRNVVPQSKREPRSPYVQSLAETVFAADLDIEKPASQEKFVTALGHAGLKADPTQEITPGYGPGVPWLPIKKKGDIAGPPASSQPVPVFDPSKLPGGETKPLNRAHIQESGIQLDNPEYPEPKPGRPSAVDEARGKLSEAGLSINNPDFLPPKPEEDQPVGASQQDRSMQQPQYGSQGQWQEAHEVAGTDPARQAALDQAYADQANATLAEGAIGANAQDIAGQGQEDSARQELSDLNQAAENQKARQAYLDQLSQGVDQDSRDMASAKIDPERFWHKDTGKRLLGAIAVFLGGLGGGENQAAKTISSMIENDVAAQRASIENKWTDIRQRHSVLRDRAAQYGSLDIAEKQQIAARLNGAMLMAQAAAARASSPSERARSAALAAQLEQKAIEAGINLNRYVAAGYVGGAGGLGPNGFTKDVKNDQIVRMPNGQWVDAGTSTNASMINQQNLASQHVIGQVDQLINLIKDPDVRNPMSHYFTDKLGQIDTLKKEITIDDLRAATGGNSARAQGMMMWLNDAIGDPKSILPYKANQSIASLGKFKQKVSEDTNLRGHEMNGAAVVERVVDPATQQAKLRIVGTYQHGGPSLQAGYGSGSSAPPATSLRLQKAGQ